VRRYKGDTKGTATATRCDEPEPAATFRSRTAGSQVESRGSAIHKYKGNVQGAQLNLAATKRSAAEDAAMKACVLCDVGRMEVREVPQPPVGTRDVLLRISAVGICGTDAHIFSGHANYNTDATGKNIPLSVQPQILGHEISGQVAEVGGEVRDLAPGDRVVIDQGLSCVSTRRELRCEYCLSGDSHQCAFYTEHGITGLPGGLAEFIAVPASNAVRLTTDLDMKEAALSEPLGCVIHSSDAVTRAQARFAIGAASQERRVRHVLICGAGPSGLLHLQYLRRVLGYDGWLMVSEPNEMKRELAKKFGADVVLDPSGGEMGAAVREHTQGGGVEYLIEASGQGRAFAAISSVIRKQATVLLYGHGHAGFGLSLLNNVMFKEPCLVTPVGASGGFEKDGRPSTYARALRLIEQGKISVAPFITHRFASLGDVQGALAGGMNAADYVKGVVALQ
jgi:threonine dehydrogenase-like Zn-dependent dehydrogenase